MAGELIKLIVETEEEIGTTLILGTREELVSTVVLETEEHNTTVDGELESQVDDTTRFVAVSSGSLLHNSVSVLGFVVNEENADGDTMFTPALRTLALCPSISDMVSR